MHRLSAADLGELFRTFGESALRIEARQVYDTPTDAADFEAFLRGEPVPPNQPWCELVRTATAAGKRMQRVRVVHEPANQYTRFELGRYIWSAAAGEDIRILIEPDGSPLLGPDFWVFDGETVVLMDYDRDGRFLGAHLARNLTPLLAIAREALAESVALSDYLALTA